MRCIYLFDISETSNAGNLNYFSSMSEKEEIENETKSLRLEDLDSKYTKAHQSIKKSHKTILNSIITKGIDNRSSK